MNYKHWINYAVQFLTDRLSNDLHLNARYDTELLLQFVTQKTKAQIIAFPETELDEKTQEKLTALLARRATGEPIAYILGETEFWSLNLSRAFLRKVCPCCLFSYKNKKKNDRTLMEH